MYSCRGDIDFSVPGSSRANRACSWAMSAWGDLSRRAAKRGGAPTAGAEESSAELSVGRQSPFFDGSHATVLVG